MRSQSSYYGYSPVQRVPQLSVPITVHGVSKMVIWCAFIVLGPYSSSYLCAPRPSISLILDLIALPPSPTSPSPTQASSTTPMLSMAKLVIHQHVRIIFFRFPFVCLAHVASRFLVAASQWCSESTSHRIVASAVSTRTHCRYHCLNSWLSFSLQAPPIVVHDGRREQATRRARQARAQRQQLAVKQQPQPKSHSPAPLRTLLRL